ncbi:MAG: hypothetical protein RL131_86 [Bacteroidota bacterium]|jgi:DNA polymerase III psi subunit
MNSRTTIKLPPALLAELYKNDLIFESHSEADSTESDSTAHSDTLVLTSVTSPANQVFLENILKACKLNPSTIPVVVVSKEKKTEHTALEEQYQPKRVLLFEVEPHDINLPIHFPPFQIQSFNNIQFLCSPSLSQLESDKELKKKLWQSLQHLYA